MSFSLCWSRPRMLRSGRSSQRSRKEIRERSAEMKLPFPLTVSAGCVHTDMTTGRDLDDYVREADAIMYEEKTCEKGEPHLSRMKRLQPDRGKV